MDAYESGSIGDLRQQGQWHQLPAQERRQQLEREMVSLLVELLVFRDASQSLGTPIGSLGVDSLQAFEIESKWEERTGITLDVTPFMKDGTVNDLIESLLRQDEKNAPTQGATERERDWTV